MASLYGRVHEHRVNYCMAKIGESSRSRQDKQTYLSDHMRVVLVCVVWTHDLLGPAGIPLPQTKQAAP